MSNRLAKRFVRQAIPASLRFEIISGGHDVYRYVPAGAVTVTGTSTVLVTFPSV